MIRLCIQRSETLLFFHPARMISGTHAGYAAFGIGGTPSSHDWCAGVDLRTVMDLAGNKTIQMTMRYARTWVLVMPRQHLKKQLPPQVPPVR
jgi:hypothetical protein